MDIIFHKQITKTCDTRKSEHQRSIETETTVLGGVFSTEINVYIRPLKPEGRREYDFDRSEVRRKEGERR